MHILQIVIKNTSTLDYSLPILKGIREKHPNSKITILYCVANKQQILRDAVFINNFCEEHKINQLDFSDFIKSPYSFLKSVYSDLFINSYSDKVMQIDKITLNNMKLFLLRYLKYFEKIVGKTIVDVKNILYILKPDIIFFDNRTVTNFYGREYFYQYFEKEKKRIILLPHAPHYITPTGEFCRFDENNTNLMPKYTEHWMPFKYGEPWLAVPKYKDQFINIGYPGLDSKWKDYLFLNQNKKNKDDSIKCLVMTRKFFSQNHIRTDNCDPFTIDYNEAKVLFIKLSTIASKVDKDVEFIIKPHPSSSQQETLNLLNEIGLTNYKITYESFYEILPNIDIVVSQFTTSLMLPIAYKIPTMILHSNAQEYVNNSWDKLNELYTGFKYYSSNTTFEENFKNILNDTSNNEDDFNHLRKFFDDNVVNCALRRLDIILNDK